MCKHAGPQLVITIHLQVIKLRSVNYVLISWFLVSVQTCLAHIFHDILYALLFSTHLSNIVTQPRGSNRGDADEHEPGASSDLPGRSSDAVGKKEVQWFTEMPCISNCS